MAKLRIFLGKYICISILFLLMVSCAGRTFVHIEDTWKYWYHDEENNLVFYTNITQPTKRSQPAYVRLRILNKNDYDVEVDYLLKIFSDKKKNEFTETEEVKGTVPKTVKDTDGYSDFEFEVDGVNQITGLEFSRFSATRF